MLPHCMWNGLSGARGLPPTGHLLFWIRWFVGLSPPLFSLALSRSHSITPKNVLADDDAQPALPGSSRPTLQRSLLLSTELSPSRQHPAAAAHAAQCLECLVVDVIVTQVEDAKVPAVRRLGQGDGTSRA